VVEEEELRDFWEGTMMAGDEDDGQAEVVVEKEEVEKEKKSGDV
jgi:hypothetical protein